MRTVIPFHSAVRKKVPDAEFLFDFEVPAIDGPVKAQAYRTEANGVPIYLIAGEPVGADAPVYSPDAAVGGQMYIFFSMAALEFVKKLDWKPDILHANDWHTALAVYALKQRRMIGSVLQGHAQCAGRAQPALHGRGERGSL